MPAKLWPRAEVCQLCSQGDRIMDLSTWLHLWSCFLLNYFGSKEEVGRSRQVSKTFVKHHRHFKLSTQWTGRQDKCSRDKEWHMKCMDVSMRDPWERYSLVRWGHVRGHWWTVLFFFHSTNSYRTSIDQALAWGLATQTWVKKSSSVLMEPTF